MHNHHSVVIILLFGTTGIATVDVPTTYLHANIIGCITICVIVLAAGATQTYHRSQNGDKHLVI